METPKTPASSDIDFQQLYDQMPVSTQVFDPQGWTIYVNRAWEQLFQAPAESARQFNVLQDEQLERSGALAAIRQAFAGDSVRLPAIPFNPHAALTDAVDELRWIQAMFYPVLREGSVVLVVVQHLDVTEQKRDEQRMLTTQQALEATIDERTITLRQKLEQIELQQAEIAALAAPLIPLTNDIIVLPLIGSVDQSRAQQLQDTIISGVASAQARMVIIDITGVPTVDTHVADTLLRAAQAVRLLGARVVLTGIRPEVAQTLIMIGVDFNQLEVYRTLQSAIEALTGIAVGA